MDKETKVPTLSKTAVSSSYFVFKYEYGEYEQLSVKFDTLKKAQVYKELWEQTQKDTLVIFKIIV